MKYILVAYLLSYSGSLSIESYGFADVDICNTYRQKIAFMTEKTNSSIRRAHFVCSPQGQL
jgi:hypothetical protein